MYEPAALCPQKVCGHGNCQTAPQEDCPERPARLDRQPIADRRPPATALRVYVDFGYDAAKWPEAEAALMRRDNSLTLLTERSRGRPQNGVDPGGPPLTDHSFLRDKTVGRDKAGTPVAPRPVSPSGFSSLKLQGRAFFVRPLFFFVRARRPRPRSVASA